MPRVLSVAFGPSRSKRVALALARARRLGVDLREIGPGRHLATFHLEADPRQFGAAWALLSEVRSVAGTEVDVDGDPEAPWEAMAMAHCARTWLRAINGCGEANRPWPKCFLCPLYEPVGVPDHVPEEWSRS